MVLVGSVLLFYRAPKSSTPIPLVPSRRNCAVPKPTTITLTSFCQDLSRRAGSPTLTTLPPSFTPARERRRPTDSRYARQVSRLIVGLIPEAVGPMTLDMQTVLGKASAAP